MSTFVRQVDRERERGPAFDRGTTTTLVQYHPVLNDPSQRRNEERTFKSEEYSFSTAAAFKLEPVLLCREHHHRVN